MSAPSDLLFALHECIEYMEEHKQLLDPWQLDVLENAKLMYAKHKRVQWYCPFCGKDLPGEQAACCGEVGHATTEEFKL